MSDARFQAVLFDVGGTLWAGDGPSRLRAAAEQLGASVDLESAARMWAEIAAVSRSPEELAKQRDLNAEAHRRCWLDLLRPTDALAPGMSEILYEQEFHPESFVVYPDVVPTLEQLAGRGLRLGVVSDVGHDIRPHLAYHGLACFFDAVVLSCEHGTVKPDPRLFQAACDDLGVAPERTLMVGDTAQSDGGAAAAGLTAVVLPPARPGFRRGLDVCVATVAPAPWSGTSPR